MPIKKTLSALLLTAWMSLAAHADPLSYARYDQVRTTDLYLDLKADFNRKTLGGYAELTLNWLDKSARNLVLDTNELSIAKVQVLNPNGRWTAASFMLDKLDVEKGRALRIALPFQPEKVRVYYHTAPSAAALQWMAPEQTLSGKRPFMFSQSEEINARSWAPVQDTPAVRFTYSARIEAPAGLRVVMSAENDQKSTGAGGWKFKMAQPIPSYLLAIAAGDLAVKETGPRSAVYAEPSVVGKAAHEFEDTEKMIKTTEQLYGPYRWGRYDLLVLPPSFPYGGMENPNMTFATPTVLVGDKSLVSLVAHELAHSWSGNLVTAAAWRDIWLNEGVTTYVQGRITEALYGKRQADEEALLDIHTLQREVGKLAANAQRLAPQPGNIDADDTLSDVAYNKGSWFLRTLEQRFGRDTFDNYLKGYFNHFAFQSITTEQMLDYLKPNLIDKYPGKMSWDEVKAWVYDPGIPKNAPIPDSPRFDAIDKERAGFLAGTLSASKLDAKDWNTQEWMYFLDGLPENPPLARMQELDAAWHLTGTPNAEIGMRWYVHAIAAGDKAAWAAAEEHMTRIGRLYLTMPVYRALSKTPDGLAFAQQVYHKAKSGYHPLTQQAVEALFEKAGKH